MVYAVKGSYEDKLTTGPLPKEMLKTHAPGEMVGRESVYYIKLEDNIQI